MNPYWRDIKKKEERKKKRKKERKKNEKRKEKPRSSRGSGCRTTGHKGEGRRRTGWAIVGVLVQLQVAKAQIRRSDSRVMMADEHGGDITVQPAREGGNS